MYKFNNDKKYLKKLPAYGITLPNGIRDTVEKINGKKTVVQRLGKIVIDGSDDEVWQRDGNSNRFICRGITVEAKMYSGRTMVYAEGYHYKKSINEDKLIFLFLNSSKLIDLYVYNYEYKSLVSFKAYLSETPLEVYYELENLIYTQI